MDFPQSTLSRPQRQENSDLETTAADLAGCVSGRPNLVEGPTQISCPLQVVNSGIDTIQVTYHADVPVQVIEALAELKARTQGDDYATQAVFRFGETEIFSFALQRTGIKLYPYVLKTGDVTLFLSSRKSDSQIPNMAVHVGSLTSQAGVLPFFKTLGRWFRLHGIKILVEKVSRVDFCCDINRAIGETGIEDDARHITRAAKYALYKQNGSITGVMVGSGSVVLRVYDKLRELQEKRADEKLHFFRKIWGDIDHVTRCEFQLRREALKELDISDTSVKTVMRSTKKIWRYLTEKWFRHTENPVDRKNKNHKRSESSTFWRKVRLAFGFTRIAAARNRKQRHVNLPSLMKQASGCMVTALAGLGMKFDDTAKLVDAGIASVSHYLAEYFKGPNRKDFETRTVNALVSF